MKILLIQPAKPFKALAGEDFSIFEPLALAISPPESPGTTM